MMWAVDVSFRVEKMVWVCVICMVLVLASPPMV